MSSKTPSHGTTEKYQPVTVVVRCRPQSKQEIANGAPISIGCSFDKREILVKLDSSSNSIQQSKTYTYDKVFDQTSKQIDVYRAVVSPLISEVVQGYNCTVFAYGQTGTGKTFTMEGERTSGSLLWDQDPLCGIIPRAIHQLFDVLNRTASDQNLNEFSVRVSYLEIYNEEIFDLLSQKSDVNFKLRIFEDQTKKGSIIIQGLEEIVVNDKNQVYSILEKGAQRRQTAATMMNARSSRSHAVFSITVLMKEVQMDGESLLKTGKLYLVDLAGSENIGRSGALDKNAREAGNINQSLLTLGRVITCLVEKRPHIPYRESKLTRLLKDSLGGHTKTCIIATISPSQADVEETLSTLDYAKRAKSVKNRPQQNLKMSQKEVVKEYTFKIDQLKRDLQAAREKNGVYLSSETYDEMQSSAVSQKAAILEYEDRLSVLNTELEKINDLFNSTQNSLNNREVELQDAKKWIDATTKIITSTHSQLKEKCKELNESQYLNEKLRHSRHLLHSFSDQLIQFSESLNTDLSVSLKKIEDQRKKENEKFQHLTEYGGELHDCQVKYHRNDGEIQEIMQRFEQKSVACIESIKKTSDDGHEEMQMKIDDKCESTVSSTVVCQNLLNEGLSSVSEIFSNQTKTVSNVNNLAINYMREYCDRLQKRYHDLNEKVNKSHYDLTELESHHASLIEVTDSFVKQEKNSKQEFLDNVIKQSNLNFDSQTELIEKSNSHLEDMKQEMISSFGSVAQSLSASLTTMINECFEKQKEMVENLCLKQKDISDRQISQMNSSKNEISSVTKTSNDILQKNVDQVSTKSHLHSAAFGSRISQAHKRIEECRKSLNSMLGDCRNVEGTVNKFFSGLQDEIVNYVFGLTNAMERISEGIKQQLTSQQNLMSDVKAFCAEKSSSITSTQSEFRLNFEKSMEELNKQFSDKLFANSILLEDVFNSYSKRILPLSVPEVPVGNTPKCKKYFTQNDIPTPMRSPDSLLSDFRNSNDAHNILETPKTNRKVVSTLLDIATTTKVPVFDLTPSPINNPISLEFERAKSFEREPSIPVDVELHENGDRELRDKENKRGRPKSAANYK